MDEVWEPVPINPDGPWQAVFFHGPTGARLFLSWHVLLRDMGPACVFGADYWEWHLIHGNVRLLVSRQVRCPPAPFEKAGRILAGMLTDLKES